MGNVSLSAIKEVNDSARTDYLRRIAELEAQVKAINEEKMNLTYAVVGLISVLMILAGMMIENFKKKFFQ